MKIILSKKGFDNAYGGVPSPVFINKEGKEEFISMPIPAIIFKKDRPEPEENKDLPEPEFRTNTCDNIKYSDIIYHNRNLGVLIEKLKDQRAVEPNPTTNAKKQANKNRLLEANSLCHFDPQLVKNANETNENWEPLFGQAGSAQGHLAKQKVKECDLFLFYGRFQLINEKTEYIGKPFSAIYGWLQVEKCINLKKIKDEKKAEIVQNNPYIKEHPHFNWHPKTENNTIYTAKKFVEIGQDKKKIDGAGLFKRLYILTEANTETNVEKRDIGKIEFLKTITDWILPICFYDSKVTLTHNHKDATYNDGLEKKWKENENDKNTCKLRAGGGYGQEFVLNYDNAEPETKKAIETWVRDLFA